MPHPVTGNLIHGGTINIGAGCSLVNGACANCYAMSVTAGLNSKMKGTAIRMIEEGGDTKRANELERLYDGTTKTVNGIEVWTGKVIPHPHRIDDFLRKTGIKPWFVSSLTDFWHEDFEDEYLADWYAAFGVNSKQRLLVLTKRPERQLELLTDPAWQKLVMEKAKKHLAKYPKAGHLSMPTTWPLPNVWNGASAGEHKVLVDVFKTLLQTPSACQWLSLEPLYADPKLGEALSEYSREASSNLKWAIFGGESGPRARPMDLEWVEKGIVDCRKYGIAPFVKQKGEVLAKTLQCKDKKGGDILEWPESIQIREYPTI